ncbi:MAG: hypothetical protein JWR89_3534 [Tardiphaga sp.]|uniref:phosphatase PAP2 family protein n=1 Tax=Tardiphaga sp. TaxID=1926292 RepID=UPI002612AAD6|nr:phosphatase PAP2 family protein [Tardiphaga sp.]MDB5503632.1 hypothetical protein [Tardiphaga sp.]
MAADALIKHRDGIVGSWSPPPPTGYPAQRDVEEPLNLRDWDPGVRASVIDFDLLSHLHFTQHSEKREDGTLSQEGVSVWHFNVTPGADQSPRTTASRIATVIRPTTEIFQSQLRFLDEYSDLREDRASEILSQTSYPFPFWASIVYLHPDRTKKTIELLDAALRLANFVEMRFKHALACRRPNEYSLQVQPIILTPGHGSFPSGHATENHMIARILWELRKAAYGMSPVLGEQLMRQAARIAINRTVAGVHFPVDTAVGQMLGLTLGRYFIQRAQAGATDFQAWRFDGERYPPEGDFDFRDFCEAGTVTEKPVPSYIAALAAQPAPDKSDILEWLWLQAVQEWRQLP